MEPADFSITHLDSVTSTSDFAAQKIREGVLSGNGAVLADCQTAGRGRNGSLWVSNSNKGLWVTLYLSNPGMKPFDAVMGVSLSVADALQEHGLSSAIKWPNDIIVGRKKICGILAETIENFLLIGLGVNLRQGEEDFPLALRGEATSLFIEQGVLTEARGFFNSVLRRFCLRAHGAENLQAYRTRLGIIDAAMEINGEAITVKGVETDGALLGLCEIDRLKKFYSGSLRWREK